MLFRSMRLSDTPCVIDLLRQVGNQDFIPPSRFWFLIRLLLPTFYIFVLEDETGLVVATTFLNRLPNPKYGWRGYIDYVVVEKSCRRRGFGRQVMTGVLTEAERLGCREVLLTTSHSNAQALYESLGFKAKPSSVLMRRAS